MAIVVLPSDQLTKVGTIALRTRTTFLAFLAVDFMEQVHGPNLNRPRVDSPHLIIRSKSALPKRCIVTNEPVSDSEYQVWDLPCIPRWLIALMFLGIFFLLTAPFVRQRCKVKAGLSKKARRTWRYKRFVLYLLVLSPLFAVAGGIATMSTILASPQQRAAAGAIATIWAICAYSGPILFVVAYFTIPFMVLHSQPMRVRQSRDGLHWVVGCSPEFLASLEEEPILELVEAGVE